MKWLGIGIAAFIIWKLIEDDGPEGNVSEGDGFTINGERQDAPGDDDL